MDELKSRLNEMIEGNYYREQLKEWLNIKDNTDEHQLFSFSIDNLFNGMDVDDIAEALRPFAKEE